MPTSAIPKELIAIVIGVMALVAGLLIHQSSDERDAQQMEAIIPGADPSALSETSALDAEQGVTARHEFFDLDQSDQTLNTAPGLAPRELPVGQNEMTQPASAHTAKNRPAARTGNASQSSAALNPSTNQHSMHNPVITVPVTGDGPLGSSQPQISLGLPGPGADPVNGGILGQGPSQAAQGLPRPDQANFGPEGPGSSQAGLTLPGPGQSQDDLDLPGPAEGPGGSLESEQPDN